MAYLETRSGNRRAATVVSVAALHAALGYAVIVGFQAEIMERVDSVFSARSYPADPPPPQPQATEAPEQDPARSPLAVPKPLLPLPPHVPDMTVVELDGSLLPKPGSGDREIFIPPMATPSPALAAPRPAVPLGNPGGWATSADYPAAELRRGIEGTARFELTIGPDGRVSSCRIVASSGSAGLDRATCENVTRRARFRPATDETGGKTTGTYGNAVSWVIPD